MILTQVDTPTQALVQVWGKGYRVTADTEEFQRLVPVADADSAHLEGRFASTQWGKLLEQLYPLSERELAAQRAIIFTETEMLSVAFARSEDRHGRPSIVLVSAHANANWNDDRLGTTVSRLVALSWRLAADYGQVFFGSPEAIGEFLRSNTFLPNRFFELASERDDLAFDWPSIIAATKRYRGVYGVATPRLITVGANVMLGTGYEAERAQQQLAFPVDGFYDTRERDIKAISRALSPWRTEPIFERPPENVEVTPPQPDLQTVVESLNRIDGTLKRLVDLLVQVLDVALRGDKKRR